MESFYGNFVQFCIHRYLIIIWKDNGTKYIFWPYYAYKMFFVHRQLCISTRAVLFLKFWYSSSLKLQASLLIHEVSNYSVGKVSCYLNARRGRKRERKKALFYLLSYLSDIRVHCILQYWNIIQRDSESKFFLFSGAYIPMYINAATKLYVIIKLYEVKWGVSCTCRRLHFPTDARYIQETPHIMWTRSVPFLESNVRSKN